MLIRPMETDRIQIRKQLEELAEESYRQFSARLTPGKDNILGVRLPLLRKIAKEILKKDWRDYLNQASDDSMEEVLLQGMVINGCNAELEEKFMLAKAFIPKIDCWAVCDSFCNGWKIKNEDQTMVWDFLQPYLISDREYDIRFGVVMLLHYLTPEYAPLAFEHFNRIRHQDYYVKMAIAWVLSMYFVHLPELTMEYLKNNNLDTFTYHKALQKAIESLRVTPESKAELREMKRK